VINSRRRSSAVLVAVVGLLFSILNITAASSQPIPLPGLVSDNPADWTPWVYGDIKSFVQVGPLMYGGGRFSTVKSAGGAHTYHRNNFLGFNASSGVVTADSPSFNGDVLTVIVDPATTRYLYIGGDFTIAGGLARSHIAKYDLLLHRVDPTFTAGANNDVSDMHFANGHLLVAGAFTRIGSVARTAFASISTSTGAADGYADETITGTQPGTSGTQIWRFAVRPQQDFLVLLGNFTAVGGQARRWAFMLNAGLSHTTLVDWNSPYLTYACSAKFPQPLSDVDFAPNGTYFGIASRGGAHLGTICDTASGWYFQPSNSAARPAWLQYTGGDTLHSIVLAGNGMYYVGGHNRWLDNTPQPGVCGYNTECRGAYTVDGLGALDAYGRAIRTWYAPRVPRGVGAQELYITPAGLWEGGDQITVDGETHPGMAFFPAP